VPSFAWRAADAAGRTLRGVEEAASPAALERTLGARGLYPLEVAPAPVREAGERRGGGRGRRAEMVESIRYLATLLSAGFPLDRALGAVARVAGRNDVATAVAEVRARVRGGARLAEGMAEHPEIFPASPWGWCARESAADTCPSRWTASPCSWSASRR
jgi:general secretion pathway protein F